MHPWVFDVCECYVFVYISRVSDQNGVSFLYIMLEIHHSGQKPSICVLCLWYLAMCIPFCRLSVFMCASENVLP